MPATPLPRSTPEAQGIPSTAISAFLTAARDGACDLHSFMLLRHGQVVAEGWWSPYAADAPHMLFSLSKSFTSTAVGMAVAEGRLSVDDPVLKFFPDKAPRDPSPNLAAMKVHHLLSMATGHDTDTTPHMTGSKTGDWARVFFRQPVVHAPGTHFLYNTGGTYMLSAIVQRLTGQTLLDYLAPRLFEPLGITGATWETCPQGVNTGGFGLSTKTEDIAKFGQLYLQGGVWEGRRLLPESWIAAASAKQSDNGSDPANDWAQGYGYQFWLCRHGAYRGDGAFGQFCVLIPEQDAVVAITAGLSGMQNVLDLIWTHLLPAMGPEALPEDAPAHGALQDQLAGLELSTGEGRESSALAAQFSGRQYRFEGKRAPFQWLRFEFGEDGATLLLRDGRGEHAVQAGRKRWLAGVTTWNPVDPRPDRPDAHQAVAASGSWLAHDTYELRAWYTETPFCVTLVCRFARDRVTVEFSLNVSFGPTRFPPLTGVAE